jgi:outer membrane receptor protein involved in Fe transport
LLWLAIAACIGPALQANAQAPVAAKPEQSITAFPPDYFAASAPANALEMVQRLPGFVIVEADADVRGYAAAQGNVLIDGARPASKREDIDDLLKRIPAQGVERIELIRSGATGIDMAGHALLANIVRRRDATTEAAIEAGVIASTDGWTAVQAQWEYGRRWGERALDLAVSLQPELDDDSGRGTIRSFGPDGVLQLQQLLDTRTTVDQGEASASWRQPLAQGRLTLTAALRSEDARSDTLITTPDEGREIVKEREDLREAEVGARFVRQIGTHSTLELVATQQLGWLESLEDAREADETETFRETTDTGETIGRIDLTHEWSPTLSLATSVEGAFNFLESDAQLQENGVPVILPGSDVRIEEERIEAAVGAIWKPAEAWVFETGLRVENSSITQTGDSPLQRRFTYPKPRVALRWDANESNQLRLSVSREVGQLEFSDFVASASLDTGVVTAGNAELEPDKTWRMVAAWEHHFWTDAALTFSWTHDRISDVVDRVLIVTPDDVFDAPGNIGDGKRDTLALEFSAPLDRFGFTGAQLRSSLLWRESEVTDPVTSERRGISEEKPFEGSVSLTQDLPALRLNWGIEFEHIAERETKYRFDEVAHESEGMGWTLFVERRLNERWRVRAEATDLFGRDFEETRDKYDGPRSSYPVAEIERRNRETPGYFSLVFRRSMGD